MKILYIEPFNAGSHRAFTELLTTQIDADWSALLLPGRHWKWRARGSATYFALNHRETLQHPYDLLIASAYLPLHDLLALCPALSTTPSLLYFHENQLAYPVREAFSGRRDMHYGFSQLISALTATRCAFNSAWNMTSFLHEGRALLARMPDARPTGWIDAIEARSAVLHLPITLPEIAPAHLTNPEEDRAAGPIILWNHRWEYDKAPEDFFAALRALVDRGVPFRVIVCGQRFKKAPPVFAEARDWLGERAIHWGYADDERAYRALLGRAHIAVSTAIHEFFGVSMVEAAHFGAHPLVPDRLAYPEIFAPEFRYKTQRDLIDRLEALCCAWIRGDIALRADRREIGAPFGAPALDRVREFIDAMINDHN